MGCRKSAQTDIMDKLGPGISDRRVLAPEHQIFAERQRKDAEGHISSGKIGGYFRGHHSGVEAEIKEREKHAL